MFRSMSGLVQRMPAQNIFHISILSRFHVILMNERNIYMREFINFKGRTAILRMKYIGMTYSIAIQSLYRASLQRFILVFSSNYHR